MILTDVSLLSILFDFLRVCGRVIAEENGVSTVKQEYDLPLGDVVWADGEIVFTSYLLQAKFDLRCFSDILRRIFQKTARELSRSEVGDVYWNEFLRRCKLERSISNISWIGEAKGSLL